MQCLWSELNGLYIRSSSVYPHIRAILVNNILNIFKYFIISCHGYSIPTLVTQWLKVMASYNSYDIHFRFHNIFPTFADLLTWPTYLTYLPTWPTWPSYLTKKPFSLIQTLTRAVLQFLQCFCYNIRAILVKNILDKNRLPPNMKQKTLPSSIWTLSSSFFLLMNLGCWINFWISIAMMIIDDKYQGNTLGFDSTPPAISSRVLNMGDIITHHNPCCHHFCQFHEEQNEKNHQNFLSRTALEPESDPFKDWGSFFLKWT